jgi:dCMP deaminase
LRLRLIPETISMAAERLSIPQYAMALAHVASLRSEDPFRKVGAAALDHDNRVIATAYNGLAPGFDAPPGFWEDREKRQKFMLHAEVNLCSLFKRGEAKLVATTTMPCTACMQTLCAYGVKQVYYRDIYHQSDAPEIADLRHPAGPGGGLSAILGNRERRATRHFGKCVETYQNTNEHHEGDRGNHETIGRGSQHHCDAVRHRPYITAAAATC